MIECGIANHIIQQCAIIVKRFAEIYVSSGKKNPTGSGARRNPWGVCVMHAGNYCAFLIRPFSMSASVVSFSET